MINHYSLWKNIVIGLIILVACIYSAPNLYPEDPAVQVSHSSGELTADSQSKILKALEDKKLQYKSYSLEDNKLLVRFANTEIQLEATDVIKAALDDQYVVALNLAPATPGWLRALNASPMNLGLDLRGGVHFLMEVDMRAAVGKAYDRFEGEFRDALREDKIFYQDVTHSGDTIVVNFRDAATRDQALKILKDVYRTQLNFDEAQSGNGYSLTAKLSEKAAQEIRQFALEQNITTLRNRVNELGVAEAVVQREGADRIVVQLPGVQDTARAKEILGATATLEFRLVDEQGDPQQAKTTGRAPIGTQLYSERSGTPILLKRQVMLTGDYITDAASGIDTDAGGPAVFITLDGKGASIFSKVSGENVQKLMAVVFIENKPVTTEENGIKIRKTITKEEVINVARIREKLGKRFQITGLESTREARDLALLLRAGALAAPVEIVEERTIGPSLGQQNIDQGKASVILGFVMVMIFMAIYYRVFGLVANVALLANVVLIFAVMSLIPGVTLTLPGIAGIVLTIGMAVDANVLIYERIREELSNGNTPQASINAGYAKALSSIADGNITTLIAAIVLFGFGTGPIKGFAVTLSIGIICSMFTAIIGTRAIINLIYGRRRNPVLSI